MAFCPAANPPPPTCKTNKQKHPAQEVRNIQCRIFPLVLEGLQEEEKGSCPNQPHPYTSRNAIFSYQDLIKHLLYAEYKFITCLLQICKHTKKLHCTPPKEQVTRIVCPPFSAEAQVTIVFLRQKISELLQKLVST